jgi:hypothetical protein
MVRIEALRMHLKLYLSVTKTSIVTEVIKVLSAEKMFLKQE